MAEYLIEAETRNTAGVVTNRLFHSGRGFNRGGLGYYQPLVLSPLIFRRTLFDAGSTSGAVATGSGAVDLVNVSGVLDGLLTEGLAGGRLTVKLIEPDVVNAYAAAETVAVLTMEQPEGGFDSISLRVRDRLYELEQKQIQTLVYAGNNVAPAGVEGTADTLRGQPKPLLYGLSREIPAVLVNGQRNIYQISSNAISAVLAVFDKGAATWAFHSFASSQTDLETGFITAGQYRVWLAGGMIRLAGNPAGLLTVDAVAGASAADRTAAQILRTMAVGPGGVATGDVVAADVTALDAANSAECGIWISTETSVRAAMEAIANSVGAWFGFDRFGKLRMKRFEAPSGTPVCTIRQIKPREAAGLTEFNLSDPQLVTANDEGRGVPPWRAVLTYRPYYAVQTSDYAGVVSTERKLALAQRTRQVTADAADVLLQFPGAGKRSYDTLLDDVTAAQAEADRRRDLHKIQRQRFKVTIKYGLLAAGLIDLGVVVTLKLPRFGLSAGKLFTVIGVDYDGAGGAADLDLWG